VGTQAGGSQYPNTSPGSPNPTSTGDYAGSNAAVDPSTGSPSATPDVGTQAGGSDASASSGPQAGSNTADEDYSGG